LTNEFVVPTMSEIAVRIRHSLTTCCTKGRTNSK